MNLRKFGGIDGGCTLGFDKHGHERLIVVGKASFDIGHGGECTLAAEQCPVVQADLHHGDPAKTSLRYECDFALEKPFADVVLNASAHAPHGRPVTELTVGLAVGSHRKLIRVRGDRIWERSLMGLRPSAPIPFVTLPLVYERAFGGTDADPEHPERYVAERRNLVGVGHFANERADVSGTPVPNLEHPDHPVTSCTRRSEPIGFGFVSRNWQPRVALAGTYDEHWREHQFPYLPEDFDARYFQGAPLDQQHPHFLGGEQIQLLNMTPEGRMAFEVPSFPMSMYLVFPGGHQQLEPRLDTLVIEPDRRRLLAVWRSNLRLPCKPTDILAVWVGTPTKGRLSAMVQKKRYLETAGMPT